MKPTPVHTEGAPAAIGPYAQAIAAGNLLWCSGQVGRAPGSTALAGPDVASQTRQALENLRAVLEAGGSGLPSVVQTTVYLVDMGDFSAMNAVYAEVFGAHAPARATVAVAGLPLGARVEIAAVAVRSG